MANPRVDFYVLDDADEDRRQVYLCRVVEKATRQGHSVWIHAPVTATALDERLWTFSQGSFVAHELAGPDADAECPVLIGDRGEPDAARDVLVNDSGEVPPFLESFGRVAEVINADPESRRRGRERFRQYRERGYELQHHEVG
ncbi:MAG: DNA polymerase III subunit chi [Halofilum sp. (in: g-proteobacteria)]|nr:DNA polymerase III subunit chi [Halofilum sp. (in: g-proteobacteria)]